MDALTGDERNLAFGVAQGKAGVAQSPFKEEALQLVALTARITSRAWWPHVTAAAIAFRLTATPLSFRTTTLPCGWANR